MIDPSTKFGAVASRLCSSLSLTVSPTPGTSIDEAAADAIALARRLEVMVEFGFNGVHCIAFPMREGHSAEQLVLNWHRAMQVKNRVATSAEPVPR